MIYKDKAGEYRVRFSEDDEVLFSTGGFPTRAAAEKAIETIADNGADAKERFDAEKDKPSQHELQQAIDSTDWTGLSKAISHKHSVIIREKADSLLGAIMQSNADIETRMNACKRVEAVILLLEAPNVPWREVVNLLAHPTLSAFLAALNLIQFILGFAT